MRKSAHKLFALLLTLVLCLAALSPAALAADENPSVKIPVSVTLSGTQPAEAETFQIKLTAAESGNPMPEGSVDGVYTASITGAGETDIEIAFGRVGIYGYTLTQIPGENGDCYYDSSSYNVTVYVTNAKDGGLETGVAIYKDGEEDKLDGANFENVYANPDQVVLQAIKTLDGEAPTDGAFAFELLDAEGSLLQVQANVGSEVTFDALSFYQQGSFTYTISEVLGDDPDVVYDQSVYTVTVDVTKDDNGNYLAAVSYAKDGEAYVGTPIFANTTVPEPIIPSAPQTGDNTNMTLWAGLMAVSAVALIAAAFIGRKKLDEEH